jgi:hypothetical protein
MSDPRDEGSPIDARVDAVLRDMVAGEGSATLRPRILAAIARERPRERWVDALPWRIALAGGLAAALGVAIFTGRILVPGSTPQVVSTRAEAPGSRPMAAPRVEPRVEPRTAATGSRPVSRSLHRETQTPRKDWEQEEPLAPIEISTIEGTSPIDLPPLRTSTIEASSLTLPALSIDALPTEPPSNGSF